MTLEPMQLTALGAAHRIYYFLCDMRQLHSADSDKRWLHVTSFVQDVLRRDNLEGSKIWRRNSKYESRILASADKAAVGVPFLTGCVQYPLPKCNLGFSGGSELLQNFNHLNNLHTFLSINVTSGSSNQSQVAHSPSNLDQPESSRSLALASPNP